MAYKARWTDAASASEEFDSEARPFSRCRCTAGQQLAEKQLRRLRAAYEAVARRCRSLPPGDELDAAFNTAAVLLHAREDAETAVMAGHLRTPEASEYDGLTAEEEETRAQLWG